MTNYEDLVNQNDKLSESSQQVQHETEMLTRRLPIEPSTVIYSSTLSTLVLTFRDADNFAQEDLSQMRLGMLVLILTYSVLCFLSAKYGRRAPDHSRCTPRES
jgi:hypothetical protein